MNDVTPFARLVARGGVGSPGVVGEPDALRWGILSQLECLKLGCAALRFPARDFRCEIESVLQVVDESHFRERKTQDRCEFIGVCVHFFEDSP